MWWRYGLIFFLFAVLPALLLFFFYTGFRGDPSKGRKRCRKCWHSLEGLPESDAGWVCPECGTRAKSEKQLYRRRRYWWRVWTGGLLIFGILTFISGAIVVDRWEGEGAGALVPSTAVVLMYPSTYEEIAREDSLGEWVDKTLRYRDGELFAWQERLIGTPTIELAPPSYDGAFDLPAEWVIGVPMPASVEVTPLVGVPSVDKLRVRSTGEGAWYETRLWFGRHSAPSSETVNLLLDAPAREADALDIQIEHTLSGDDFAVPFRRAFDSTVSVPAPRWISLEEATSGTIVSPVTDSEYDRWLLERRWIDLDVDAASFNILLSSQGDALWEYDSPRVDFVLEAAVYDGDAVICRRVIHRVSQLASFEWVADDALLAILGGTHDGCRENLDRMTLRLTPRPDLAIVYPHYAVFWAPADGAPYLQTTLREAMLGPHATRHTLEPLFSPAADALRKKAASP